MSVHEGVKYPCVQCGKQLTSQSNLAEHKKAVHEGVKYPCRQCNYQASTKGNLGEQSIKAQCMKESNVLAGNATIKQAQKAPLLNMKGQYINSQIPLLCNYQASTKRSLPEHQRAVHEGVKYSCSQCNYQATTKVSLTQHQKAVHEGVKYPCVQCRKQFTSHSNLAEHKRAVHEKIKYFCMQCNHQASTKANLARHHRAVNEGVKRALKNQD